MQRQFLTLVLLLLLPAILYASKIEILICSLFARGHLNPHIDLAKQLLAHYPNKYHITFCGLSIPSKNISQTLQQEFTNDVCDWSPTQTGANDCNVTYISFGDFFAPGLSDTATPAENFKTLHSLAPTIIKQMYVSFYEIYVWGNRTQIPSNRPKIPQFAIMGTFGFVNMAKVLKKVFPQTKVVISWPGAPEMLSLFFSNSTLATTIPNPLLVSAGSIIAKHFPRLLPSNLTFEKNEYPYSFPYALQVNQLFQYLSPLPIFELILLASHYIIGRNQDVFYSQIPELRKLYSPFEAIRTSPILVFTPKILMKDILVTNLIPLGSHLPKEKLNISHPVLTWLQTQQKVIFISMGSQFTMNQEQVQLFLDGLIALCHQSQHQYSFLWRVRSDHVHFAKEEFDKHNCSAYIDSQYMPQLPILQHSAVKLFVTHCGMNSMNEGLFYGKRLVGFPIAADQFLNCQKVVDSKLGNQIVKDISANLIQTTLQQVLESEEIEQNVKILSERMRSEITAVETFDQLVSEALQQEHWEQQYAPLFEEEQQELLDKYQTFLISFACFMILFVYLTCKCCCCCCCCCRRKAAKAKQD